VCERRERCAALRIESLRRVDKAQVSSLSKIVEGDPAGQLLRDFASDCLGISHVPLDETVIRFVHCDHC
jgi:hypothetical protein